MRRPRRLVVAPTVVVAVLLAAAAAPWATGRMVAALLDVDGPYHLLVLGSDFDPVHGANDRSRGTNALVGRADAIHLLSLSADRSQVSIVSFPRDALANVPGRGRTRINAGLVRGPENMVAAVQGLTGVTIHDWAVASFSGVTHAIGAVGGVSIDVEQRLFDRYGSSSDLQPGRQHLNGWQALTYARDRYSRSDGDFGRSTAQATVLRELHAQQIAGASPAGLAELLFVLRAHVATSIPAHRLVALAAVAAGLDPGQVTHVQLRGRNTSVGGASVVALNADAERVFAQLRQQGVASG